MNEEARPGFAFGFGLAGLLAAGLAYVGFELNGINTPAGGPIGRVEFQFGSYIATIHGQDASLQRGFYLSNPTLSYVKQAGVGWHFHWLHGVNIEAGIFPSYIALESYVPQENWSYTHPFVSDFTPYYFAGLRTQIFPTENTKLELWFVNGWQTFGRWHDALTGGYLFNWRPSGRLLLTHTAYFGQEQSRFADPNSHSFRAYTDNYVQVLAFDISVPRSAMAVKSDGKLNPCLSCRTQRLPDASAAHEKKTAPIGDRSRFAAGSRSAIR